MDTKRINQVTMNLLDWLNTWRQEDGAYNGWVVHRFDLKRLKYIHDTPWEQTPMIDGLFNLYRTTGIEKYYQMAKESVLLQISRLDIKTGMFNYAGFEDDRFSSLVHNALADCALLTFAENCRAEDGEIRQKALDTVKRNLDQYFLKVLYSEQAQAFKFSVVDYYWPDEDRYVANMNSVAVEALIRYSILTGEERYREIALKVIKLVTSLFCGRTGAMEEGGIGYANTHPDLFISIYTALTLRGICEVYKLNGDEHLKQLLISSAEHLLRLTENGYFCHAVLNGVQTPYPYWIAGGGMILKGINDVERATGVCFETDAMLERIISHQLHCGGISSFSKYNSTDNHRKKNRPNTIVWEDKAPGPPWNAHLFEYLTRFVDQDFDEFQPNNTTSFCLKPWFVYFESKKHFFVMSLLPLFSCALVWINKKKDKSIIGFSLRHLYGKIIKRLRKKK